MSDKEQPARATPGGVVRKLAAILSADVVGYSRLMGEDEVDTLRTLTAYRKIVDALIERHRGRIVGTAGDSVLAEFASVVDAVQCAMEIQTSLKAENASLPPERQMRFRIGINLGDVIVEGETIYGDGVNIAARLQALADSGGICLSGTVHEHLGNKLPLHYEDLGEQTVKNIAKPVRVYRVIMEPEEVRSPKSEVRSPESKGKSQKPRRVDTVHRPWAAVVVGLLLIVGAVVAVRYLSPPPIRTPQSEIRNQEEPALALPLPDKPSIAVLPFTNMSGDPEQEYFSDGITEDITTELSKISGLFVIARHSAFIYKGKAVKVREVGQELGVRYVLEGSIRKADHQLRISAQLVDTTTGYHLWSERYDRLLQDVFALQDEIRQKIITALKVKLTAEEQARYRQAPTDNLEAYDYYVRGVEYIERSTFGTDVPALQEVNVQARQMLEKATELDPQYAAAYARLGQTYLREWVYQGDANPQPLEQAFVLAQKAVALNDSLPIAHIILGQVYIWRKQPELALTHGYRARALAPNDPEIAVGMAGILNDVKGGGGEAIGLVEMAMRLNPHNSERYLFVLGQAYRLMWSEETIAAYKRVLARNPTALMARLLLIRTYMEAGREEEARAEATEVLKSDPSFSLESIRQKVPIAFLNQQAFERFLNILHQAGLK